MSLAAARALVSALSAPPSGPAIVIDSREQRPWHLPGRRVVRRALPAGDYSIEGLETRAAIERKSLGDLVGSLTAGRDRFDRELARLATYDRAVIVVEAPLGAVIERRYRYSQVSPSAIIGSIASIEARHGISTIWAGSAVYAAHLADAILAKWAKHLLDPERLAELEAKLTEVSA